MTYDPKEHHRRSVRLKGYDYAWAGAYFVTICAQGRACLFGEVVEGQVRLNGAGRMLLTEWDALAARFPIIALDAFVVMPNHVHGIIVISDVPDGATVGAGLVPALGGGGATNRATTRVAPTPALGGGGATNRATTRVAPTPALGGGGATNRATTRVAPTPALDRGGTADRATTRVAPTLGDVVGVFKSRTTVEYIRGVKTDGWPPFDGRLWQRNYYEHIIRDDESLNCVRQSILDNPARWAFDRENPATAGREPEGTGA